MLSPKTFRCRRCGDCCKVYTIKLKNKDIKRIGKKYPGDYFLSYDEFEECFVMKRAKNKCIFLKRKNGKYSCGIYCIRPETCRKYPFFRKNVESCKPVTIKTFLNKPHFLYTNNL